TVPALLSTFTLSLHDALPISVDYYGGRCKLSSDYYEGGAMTAAARHRPLWLVILATALPMFMATLDNLVVTNALPVIARDLSAEDRKSTRLNSSHVKISYAVF